jgi:hypothetical protein
MVSSLLEGWPQTGRPLFQAAASENVLASGKNECRRGLDGPVDPTQCGAARSDYVNETRGFVMELGFPSWAGPCETARVKRSIHLCRLLAVLLIAGLVFAPLAARANVDSMGSMTMVGDAAAMSDDMPCCPDKSAPVDCGQCPLMALCVSTTLQAPLPAGVAELQPVILRMLRPGSDPEVESLGYSPPPRPPRSLDLLA